MEGIVKDGDTYILDEYLHVKVLPFEPEVLRREAVLRARRLELLGQGKTREEAEAIIQKEYLEAMDDLDVHRSPPSIQELHENHLRRKRDFEASDGWKSLKTHLTAEQERGGLKITKMVGLGMGSCQNNSYGSVDRQSLPKETAFLSVLMAFFGLTTCVSQDPIFGETDRDFLELLGHTVVEDPEAFKLIDEETFVWADHSNVNVYDAIARGVHPAVLICFDLSTVTILLSMRDEYLRTKTLVEEALARMLDELKRKEAAYCSPRRMIEHFSHWPWGSDVLDFRSKLVVYSKKKELP